ncbi:MAG TPA: hypothetical protein DCG69_11085 [Bacteroidales bacterium]|nr:hypothetical protein [Bacteroidales bacterium]
MKNIRNLLAYNLLLIKPVTPSFWLINYKHSSLSTLICELGIFKNKKIDYLGNDTSVGLSYFSSLSPKMLALHFSPASFFQELINDNINQTNFDRYGK